MIMLLQDPAVIHCTFHILSSPSYHATSDMNPLRLELYSDILHALALNNVCPREMLISIHHSRAMHDVDLLLIIIDHCCSILR
jgi:hypothetical protein